MSGYGGNPDIDSEQQLIMSENEVNRARSMIPEGTSATSCYDCGMAIPEARRQAQKGCKYCIECQPYHDRVRRVKMTSGSLD